MSRGLADTSVFIARETDRELDERSLPDEIAVSVIPEQRSNHCALHPLEAASSVIGWPRP